MEATITPYRQALLTAWEMGRADGTSAAAWDIEPRESPPAPGHPRGRSPEAFARYLWAHQPGRPPSALELNGPLWYSTGFREALHQALEGEPQRADVASSAPPQPRS